MATTDLSESAKRVSEFAAAEVGVIAAYIFGSVALGRETAESDIDIGILFASDRIPDGLGRRDIGARLEETLGRDVDLIVLNDAKPIVVHQILRGLQAYCGEPRATARFIVRANAEYDDLKRVRRPIERALLRGRVFDGR